MGGMPEVRTRIAEAIAVFDAQVQLMAKGWDLESIRCLTWVVDAQPAESGDRAMTYTAHFEDTRESSRIAKASDRAAVTAHPLPMPMEPEQYWTSVTLRSGGTLTLSVSVLPSNLRGDDLTLFNDLVNRLTAYQEDAVRAVEGRPTSTRRRETTLPQPDLNRD